MRVKAQSRECLAAPQRESRRLAPRLTRQHQHHCVQHGEREPAPHQRRHPATRRRVPAGHHPQQCQRPELQHNGRAIADQPLRRRGRESGQRPPETHVPGPKRRADDEAGQCADQPGIAAAQRKQRTRRAAAADLHPGAEQQRTDREPNTDLRRSADQLLAPKRIQRQQWQDEQARQRQHGRMSAKARRIPPFNQRPKRAGKTKRRPQQHRPDRRTGQHQQRVAPCRARRLRHGNHQRDHQRDAGRKHSLVEADAGPRWRENKAGHGETPTDIITCAAQHGRPARVWSQRRSLLS